MVRATELLVLGSCLVAATAAGAAEVGIHDRFEHVVLNTTAYADPFRDVTLEVARGESFGLVGRNGAGKSTLLRLVARVLRPTTGRVRTWGQVAPLLEFGAGFHPDLTGRENVFLNGALLGLSRATLKRSFESIVSFADLDGFIDAVRPIQRR